MAVAPDFSKGHNGLLPVIAQDAVTGEVLMLAYMNEAALTQTRETGRATYFSRSRNAMWVKGETSGHIQTVREVLFDCDGDTILLKVDQEGAACHEGYPSCFYRRMTEGDPEVVMERLVDPGDVYGK